MVRTWKFGATGSVLIGLAVLAACSGSGEDDGTGGKGSGAGATGGSGGATGGTGGATGGTGGATGGTGGATGGTAGSMGGNLRQPMKLVDVKPRYPSVLADAGVGGVFVFGARIGTDGTIVDLQPTSSTNPDLELAAVTARNASASRTVAFNDDLTYTIDQTRDLNRGGDTYRVRLADEPYGATQVKASFGGDAVVVFDGYGAPDTDGTVVVEVGSVRKTVTLDPNGKASVQ